MLTELTPSLQQWLAEQKLKWIQDEPLIQRLVSAGFTAKQANQALTDLNGHPLFQAGLPFADQLRKRNAVLEIRRVLRAQRPQPSVPRFDHLDPEQFHNSFYYQNQPVVFRNKFAEGNRFHHWTLDALAQAYGNHKVVIQQGRETKPDYHRDPAALYQTTSLQAFVDWVRTVPSSNDAYLALGLPDLKLSGLNLYADITSLPGILGPSEDQDINLWLGPAGTLTRIHHDLRNYVLAQVQGHKRVWLVSPEESHLLYDDHSIYSPVDLEVPDHQTFPLLARATIHAMDLAPGDLLFIPVGWWHQVRALNASISVNFGNFIAPNRYHW